MTQSAERLPVRDAVTWLVLAPGLVLLVLALPVLIPLGDILSVIHERGLSAPGYLMLHGASGHYMTAAAL